jgi:hypothetical protein
LYTAASSVSTRNIGKSEQQASNTSKSSIQNTILKTFSVNETMPTTNTTNLPTSTISIAISDNSTYETVTVPGEIISNATTGYYYYSNSTYATVRSGKSLSTVTIIGIIVGIIVLLCICSGCGYYKRQEIWELRRIR